jgi:hypothetical protein
VSWLIDVRNDGLMIGMSVDVVHLASCWMDCVGGM